PLLSERLRESFPTRGSCRSRPGPELWEASRRHRPSHAPGFGYSPQASEGPATRRRLSARSRPRADVRAQPEDCRSPVRDSARTERPPVLLVSACQNESYLLQGISHKEAQKAQNLFCESCAFLWLFLILIRDLDLLRLRLLLLRQGDLQHAILIIGTNLLFVHCHRYGK